MARFQIIRGAGYGNPYINSLVWGGRIWDPAAGPIKIWAGGAGLTQLNPAAAARGNDYGYFGAPEQLADYTQMANWTSQELTALGQILDNYAAVSNLTFTGAASISDADIVWWKAYLTTGGPGTLLGVHETPSTGRNKIWGYFNHFAENWAYMWPGGEGYYTMIHEIGHGLGLAHPHDGGGEADKNVFPGVDNNQDQGDYNLNQNYTTVMSYVTGQDGNDQLGGQGTLAPFDIAALQAMYGANMNWATGANTYLLPHSNTAGVAYRYTVWDAGGIDAISAGSINTSVQIDLRAATLLPNDPFAAGYLSWTHGVLGGITIANGVVIENAIGGGGADTLIGSAANNTLTGGGGNDAIDGVTGLDTAVYTGNRSQYTYSRNAEGSWTIVDNRGGSPDGTDTLYNIRYLQFADQIVDLHPTVAPTISGYNANPGRVLDTATFNPFAGVVIADSDSATVTAYFAYDVAKGLMTAGAQSLAAAGWSALPNPQGQFTTYGFSGSVAAVQSALQNLIYNPNDRANVSVNFVDDRTAFTIAISDGNVIVAGQNVNVTISANRAPVVTAGQVFDNRLSENTPTSTNGPSIGLVGATDANPNDVVRYEVVGTKYTALFGFSDATLFAKQVFDYESTAVGYDGADANGKYFDVTVRALDLSNDASATQTVRVYVEDVNEAPTNVTFSGAATLRAGSSRSGDNVVLATAVDPDTTAGFATNRYRFSNGTTTTDDGYFTINATTGQVTLNRNLATTDAGSRSFSVIAFDATNTALASAAVNYTVTIANPAPVVSIAAGTTPAAEGGAGTTAAYTYVVTRDSTAGSSTVTWAVAGSGASAATTSDFIGGSFPSGTVSFSAGQTAATITVNVAGDATVEPNETFTVTLTAGTNATVSGTNGSITSTIVNDDVPTPVVSIAAGTVPAGEGGAGVTTAYTYVVTRDTTMGSSTVTWAVAGSGANAASASDFVGGSLPSGTVSFSAGETSKTITVNVAGDATVEPNETFTVTLTAGANSTVSGTAGSVTSTITNDDVAPPTVSIAAGTAPAGEGGAGATTAYTYVVTRDSSVGSSSVIWAVAASGTNAANGADFVGGSLPSGIVSFSAGETSKTITVNVAGDSTVEPSETFTVSLTSGSNATISTTNGSVTSTITNDDFPTPTVSIAAGTVPAAEGGAGATTAYTYVVTRDTTMGSSTVTWAVAGSGANAAAPADFVGGSLPSGTVSFSAGETSKTITVNVAGDATVEPNETFTVTLTAGSNSTISGTASSVTSTITNDDLPVVSIAAGTTPTTEGGTGTTAAYTYVITRDSSIGSSTVTWAVAGSGANAAAPTDFVGGSLPSGTVSFSAGQTAATITINVVGDNAVEQNETFTVTLSAGTNATVSGTAGSIASAIVSDDATVSIAASAVPAAEGAGGGVAGYTYVITRDNSVGSGSVTWAVTGSGTNPVSETDFVGATLPSGTVSFSAGETAKTITVNVAGDDVVELSETFTVTLTAGSNTVVSSTNGSVTSTITNDDIPIVSIAASGPVPGGEGASGVTTAYTYVITRDSSVGSSTVTWAASSTSATGADFVGGSLPSGTVSFSAGETAKTITVNVAGDNAVEPDESFTVTLSAGTNAAVSGTNGSVTSLIANDDAAPGTPVVQFSTANPSITLTEGSHGGWTEYVYTLSRDTTSGNSTVSWSIAGTGINDQDVEQLSGTASFADGSSNASITIRVKADTDIESDETFTVTLGLASNGNATIGANNTATGIITSDELPPTPVVQFSTSSPSVTSAERSDGGWVEYVYTLSRDLTTAGASTVAWSIAGTGITAEDVEQLSGTATFATNAATTTFTVRVKADTVVEENEIFTVTLGAATNGNATIGANSTASGTIINDDFPVVSIAAGTVPAQEGGAGTTAAYTYVVTRDSSVGSSSVTWAVAGTSANAVDPTDFVGGSLPSGTVSFLVGETSKTITVNVAGDATVEPSEQFTVTLTAGSNATVSGIASSVTSTIVTDDFAAPVVSIAASAPIPSAEGGAGATTAYTYVVTRDATAGSSTVTWAVAGSGTNAASASDFVGGSFPSGTISFSAGESSKTITVNVAGDATVEPNETFTVTLTAGTNATVSDTAGSVTSTITNDDAPAPVVQFTTANPSVSNTEGSNGNFVDYVYTLTRDVTTAGPSTVTWSIAGTGIDASDVEQLTGTATFAGNAATTTFTVRVRSDTRAEANETFTVSLGATATGNATIGGNNTATGIIINDDVAPVPVVQFATANPTVSRNEGAMGETTAYTYVITRNSAEGSSTVTWAVTGAAANGADASDFVGNALPGGTVTFSEGQTSQTITVNVAGDASVESNEGFTVTLSAGINATIGTSRTASGMISNDDGTSLNARPEVAVDPTRAVTGAIDNRGTVNAFRGVTFSDAENNPLTVKISFNASHGTLVLPANLSGYLGSTVANGLRTFTFQGSAETLGDLMEALAFDATTRATAAAGSVQTTDITIEVNDTANASAPGNVGQVSVRTTAGKTALSGTSVTEIANNDIAVGVLTEANSDGAAFRYELVEDAGGRFKIAADGKTIVVANGLLLDFEQATSHTITLKVNVDGTGSFEQSFTIDVRDVATETIVGSDNDDDFKGDDSGDNISGGKGFDTLAGGKGIDTLTGGEGQDTFLFDTRFNNRTNVDIIKDYDVATDQIYLDNALFRSNKALNRIIKNATEDAPVALQEQFFRVGTRARDGNDFFIYNPETRTLSYDADGRGSRAPVKIATFDANPSLASFSAGELFFV